MLVGLAIIGVVSAISIPVFLESSARNSLYTGSERIGATIRSTRLKAISQNRTFRVRFDCPSANQMRALVLTGNATIDNATNRCYNTQTGDGEVVEMPTGVTYDPEDATEIQISPRGVVTAVGDSIPLVITASYGANTRTVTVSPTGQLTYNP